MSVEEYETELASLRAENERLKDQIKETELTNNRDFTNLRRMCADKEIELRKRCEDLEAALKEYYEWHCRCVDLQMFSPASGSPIRSKVKKLLSQ